MVYAVYIAAAAVIGLLIGFVALSVLWLKKTVLKNIRSRTLELLSVYDELLEKKSSRLNELEHQAAIVAEQDREQTGSRMSAQQESEKEAVRSNSGLSGMTKQNGADAYRDPMLGDIYRKIRENFSFYPDEIIEILTESKLPEHENPAGDLLQELNPDTVYRLSCLEPETQLAILRESLGTKEAELLDDYMKKHRTFGVLEFYDDLFFRAETENTHAILNVPKSACSGSLELESVTVLPDEEICEGFWLEEGRMLYDYCIKARELG